MISANINGKVRTCNIKFIKINPWYRRIISIIYIKIPEKAISYDLLNDTIAGLKSTVNSTIGEDNFKTLSDWI